MFEMGLITVLLIIVIPFMIFAWVMRWVFQISEIVRLLKKIAGEGVPVTNYRAEIPKVAKV